MLAADSFRAVVDARAGGARAAKRAIIWGLGGHVIKCGLAPVLLDLMHRGYATAFAMNGSAAIHDFEIAHRRPHQRGRRGGAAGRPLRRGRGDRAAR